MVPSFRSTPPLSGAMRRLLAQLALLALPLQAAALPQGETTRVDLRRPGLQGQGDSAGVSLSASGRYLAYSSVVTDLVPGDTNGLRDVFWTDRLTGEVRRVNLGAAGEQSNGNTASAAISANGQVVAFMSLGSNLVPGDTNGFQDIFVYDVASRTLVRANVDSSGNQSDGSFAGRPALSADGRYVAFESSASNHVPGDTNGAGDVFRHDRVSGQTIRVSVDSSGAEGDGASSYPSISADGRFVAFASAATNLVPGDTNGQMDIFVHDTATGETTRVSVDSAGVQANSISQWTSLSADGRLVAFESRATNLVPDDTNARADVFVHDRVTGQTERVSVSSSGVQGNNNSQVPSISADGRYVVFQSIATDLVPGDTNGSMDVFRRDRQLGITLRISVGPGGVQGDGLSRDSDVSGDGRYVAFESLATNLVPSDANTHSDVFLRDTLLGATHVASVCGFGTQSWGISSQPRVSADGRFVAFVSWASDLVPDDTNSVADVFVHDRLAGSIERVSVGAGAAQGTGDSEGPFLSRDGRYVAFTSSSSNLVPGDTNGRFDVFVRDRWLGLTERVSVSTAGVQANNDCFPRHISGDGRFVVFTSFATSLVPGTTNSAMDVFVRDRLAGTTERVSLAWDGSEGNSHSTNAGISADGRFIAFESLASNLVVGDTNGRSDIFVRDRLWNETRRVSVSSGGSQGNDHSYRPSLSDDGRWVFFESEAFNLVMGDANFHRDIFAHDRQLGLTSLVSVSHAGQSTNGSSYDARISGDGRWVTFESYATNLVVGDMTIVSDVYLRDRDAGTTWMVSVSSEEVQGDGSSSLPAVSEDGRHVVYTSVATNLVPHDTNASADIFVRDRFPLAPVAFCYGDGSGIACPCGNAGAFGHGCANGTFAQGARLRSEGDSSVSADSLVLAVDGSSPLNPGLLFQGTQAANAFAGTPMGDGIFCSGGAIVRLQILFADGAGAAASSASLSAVGAVSAGDTRYYQWWYRDSALSPCSSFFNLSNGVRVVWVP